ncbi:hypothetical protein AQUCO_02700065v1 [Aquilegia coerulea]|uniref:Uncharacterized protein n=1 Tax=Aquilegia coerulea TaxID=218851 RepID=A0A2G5D513_AQUCA|nr:hypothetical protein AQUCO_02700065v1 [Aquilegia coerulea]
MESIVTKTGKGLYWCRRVVYIGSDRAFSFLTFLISLKFLFQHDFSTKHWISFKKSSSTFLLVSLFFW